MQIQAAAAANTITIRRLSAKERSPQALRMYVEGTAVK